MASDKPQKCCKDETDEIELCVPAFKHNVSLGWSVSYGTELGWLEIFARNFETFNRFGFYVHQPFELLKKWFTIENM